MLIAANIQFLDGNSKNCVVLSTAGNWGQIKCTMGLSDNLKQTNQGLRSSILVFTGRKYKSKRQEGGTLLFNHKVFFLLVLVRVSAFATFTQVEKACY